MPDNEPMIKLEPGGKAPILSYNVPEPTSYPGRNFIDLQVPAEDFSPSVGLPANVPEPDIVSVERDGSVGAARSVGDFAGTEAPDGSQLGVRYEVVTPRGVYDVPSEASEPSAEAELRPLDGGALTSVARANKVPEIYRSMYGTLSFQPRATVERHPDGEPEIPIGEPFVLVFNITSPANGAQIAGPSSGVTLNVKGVARLESGSGFLQKIQVQIGSAAFADATRNAQGEWTFSGVVNQEGLVTVTAKLVYIRFNRTFTRDTSVLVGVSFVSVSPGDTLPPAVSITNPTNDQIITAPSGSTTIQMSGSASDNQSGVKQVELVVDGGSYSPATPKAPNDWSEWKGTLVLPTEGTHTLTARCMDNAGNQWPASVTVRVSTQPVVVPKLTRLLLVESYRLSSYLGAYGAGRTIKTFSLLPGEKTKISVKSFRRSATDKKDTSTILDSFTQEASDDFEKSTAAEQSYKQNYDESFKYTVRGEAEASWGWGSAKISAEASGSTNAAREEFAKNITNATQKHASKASAKRDVQVNTSYEVKTEEGEETSIERELENINVSRTLNFVFRQMNQEHISILHLVDVRVGYVRIDIVDDQPITTFREATIPQLDSLLNEVIVENKREHYRQAIVNQLTSVFDYLDEPKSFVEEKALQDPSDTYLRVKKNVVSTYKDDATGTEIKVPGIIVAATKNVLRTEGVIVDALLGQGDGLDSYSHGLQDEAVKSRQLENSQVDSELKKDEIARKVVEEKDKDAASLFKQVYPCCPDEWPSLVLTTKPEKDDREG